MTTSFHDMTVSQRAKWLAWANSHDWGAAAARWVADTATGRIAMRVQVGIMNAPENGPQVETHLATTPADLRSWAGY